MAITFVAAGTAANAASGNISPGLPAGFAQDDIHVCVVTGGDNVTVTFPAGWTKKLETNNGTALRQTVAWRRAVAGDTAPTVTHTAGDDVVARIFGFRGCVASGDPIEASLATTGTTVTVTANAITPVNANAAIVYIGSEGVAGSTDGSPTWASYSGTNPVFAEIGDDRTPGLGVNDVSQAAAWGLKNDTTTTGNRTATVSAPSTGTVNNVGTLIAVTPATSTGGTPNFDYPPIRGHHPMKFRPGSRMRRGSTLILGAQTFLASLSGSTTPTGAIANQTSKALGGASTPTGAVARLVQLAKAGAVSPAGALAKLAQLAKAGASSPTGALARLAQLLKTGSATPAGVIAKQDTKAVAGSIAPAGSLSKLVSKMLGGSISPTGTLGRALVKLLALAGSISPTGLIAKQPKKTLAGSAAPTGAVAKAAARAYSGGINPVGALAKVAAKKAAGAISPGGALARALLNANTFVTTMFDRSKAFGQKLMFARTRGRRLTFDPSSADGRKQMFEANTEADNFDPPNPEL